MKRYLLVVALSACLLLSAACSYFSKTSAETFDDPPHPSGPPEEVRVVSLKALQTKLRDCQPKNTCSNELFRFAGLNTILGFAADETNQDMIFFGQSDPGLPPLYLEDFVIALRNVGMKYAPLEGNVYQYSFPGCSIDPVPQVMKELQMIEQQFAASRSLSEIERVLGSWRRSCQKPQTVAVMGIPFDTRFAHVMVKADYDMKILADGSDKLDTPGFISMTDMALEEARQAVLQKQAASISISGLNRFWFYPGENVYEEDQGAVFLKYCPVNLLTEKMYSDAGGKALHTGMVHPQAKRFADNFTALYDEMARQRPIYRELENLFRFVALANLMKPEKTVSVDLLYLIEDFKIASTPVAKSLPGRYAVKDWEHREETQQGSSTLRLWFPSCGGVDIAIDERKRRIERNSMGRLAALGTEARKNRPSPDSYTWIFKDSSYGLSELKDNARLYHINRGSRLSYVLTVIYKQLDGYLVLDGGSEPLYFGKDLAELGRRIEAKLGTSSTKDIWFDFKDFPGEHREEAFLSNYRNVNGELNPQRKANQLPGRRNGSTEEQDQLLSFGVSYQEQESEIIPVTEGKYQGWYQLKLSVLVRVKGVIRQVKVLIFVRTPELARALLAEVTRHFLAREFSSENLIDCMSEIERNFKRNNPSADVRKVFGEFPESWFNSKLMLNVITDRAS
jgi:hypothetical protein